MYIKGDYFTEQEISIFEDIVQQTTHRPGMLIEIGNTTFKKRTIRDQYFKIYAIRLQKQRGYYSLVVFIKDVTANFKGAKQFKEIKSSDVKLESPLSHKLWLCRRKSDLKSSEILSIIKENKLPMSAVVCKKRYLIESNIYEEKVMDRISYITKLKE